MNSTRQKTISKFSDESLRRLGGMVRSDGSIRIPMFDAKFYYVGWQKQDGNSKIIDGKHGVFIPDDLRWKGTLFILEGASDTAAMLDIDRDAIGLTSNSMSNVARKYVVDLVKPYNTIILVRDRDGGEGICNDIACRLVKRYPDKTIKIIQQPSNYADFREWKESYSCFKKLKNRITSKIRAAPRFDPAAVKESAKGEDSDNSRSIRYWLSRAFADIENGEGRNNALSNAFQQCRDDGWKREDAIAEISWLMKHVPEGDHPYTEAEAKSSIMSAFTRSKRNRAENPNSIFEYEPVCFADIEPMEEPDWLEQYLTAKGELTIAFGDGGAGKTTWAAHHCAKITTGEPFFSSLKKRRPQNIAYLGGENGQSDFRHKLDRNGADPSRAFYLPMEMISKTGRTKAISLDQHIDKLAAALEKIGDVAVLLVDPLSDFLGKANMDSDAEIRDKVLSPLNRLARRMNMAVILIVHVGKSEDRKAMHRCLGSVAIGNKARLAWAFGHDETEGKFHMGCTKMQFGKKPSSRMFVNDDFRVKWKAANSPLTADEILKLGSDTKCGRGQETKVFVVDLLQPSGTKVGVTDIKSAVEAADYSWETVQRKRKSWGILSEEHRDDSERITHWTWRLDPARFPCDGSDQTDPPVPTGRQSKKPDGTVGIDGTGVLRTREADRPKKRKVKVKRVKRRRSRER